MLKKSWCILIIMTLLYADIAYPLSPPRDSDSNQPVYTLISILEFVKSNPADSQELSARFNVKVNRDASGVWLDGKSWKMRFFEPKKDAAPQLDSDSELIFEDKIKDKLMVQVYFKGLSDVDKETIRAFLFNNPCVSGLGRMVLEEIAGRTRTPGAGGKIVRREVSRETEETLSQFISGLGTQEILDAIIREIGVEVDTKTRDVIRDYVSVFTRRMHVKKDWDRGNIFILKRLSELENEEIYGAVRRTIEDTIGRGKRLKIVSPNVIARVVARYEKMKEKDVDPDSIISFTWGDTIYFNSDSRLSDFVFYILHEIVHLYGGKELDSRRMDKEVISVIKGMISYLRKTRVEDQARRDLLNSISDVMEYEVLGYEIDFHTARLQVSNSGGVFLRHFHLAGINIVPPDPSYVRGMKGRIRGVISEGRDAELFNEIEDVIKAAEPEKIGFGLFRVFMEYIKRVAKGRAEEKEEFLQEGPELLPFYESVLSYVITREEAERRLRDVVLNPDAPLFARINDAIMLDMFSQTENVELKAVESIKPILEKEPIKALEILEELRNRKSVELISGFLSHSDPKVRLIAAERLFRIVRALAPNVIFSSPQTIENLLAFVNRPEIDVKDPELEAVFQIITVLSSIRCKDAAPVFLDIIEKNKSRRIRKFVAGALGSIGDTSVIPKVRDRIWQKGDTYSMEISVSCLEEVPNDESAGIIIDTFMKTNNKKLKLHCLKALETVVKKRRISTDVMRTMVSPLMKIVVADEEMAGLNFILGRVASIAIQEGKLELFKGITINSWLRYIKANPVALAEFSKGLIHDTFMDITDVKGVDCDNPLKEVFDLILKDMVGKWADLIEYMQKMKDDIYMGRREYTDGIWKRIAEQLRKIKPEEEMSIGKEWFQRMCLGIAYRALLDTWDIGKIEDRDFILELMLLRSSFVSEDELPKGAIGATEAIHGDYVDLDNSLFSNPENIPSGVDTVWHEATHLLSAMGVADISDVGLLGASSHSSIEFYLLSEIFRLPSITDVAERVKNGEPVEDILKDYQDRGMLEENLGAVKAVLQGMAVRDKAKGPLEAFFMVRNIKPKGVRDLAWEDVLRRLQKINNEIIYAFTIRGKYQVLVHTYLDGARFSGYAQRLGVETGFYDAANIYTEILVKYRLRPGQAEFISRVIAKFMTENTDLIDRMQQELKGQYKDIPSGEINKWLKRYIMEEIKVLSFKMSRDIKMWVTYDELNGLVDSAYKEIRKEMEKPQVQKGISSNVIRAIRTGKKIFKAVRPGYKRSAAPKGVAHIEDTEGITRPVGIYKLENQRYIEVDIDFGQGEEPYAYVDTQNREIRLVNPEDIRIDIGAIGEILGMELTRNDSLEVDSSKEEEVIEKKEVEDIEVKLPRELRWELKMSRTINKEIRGFIKALKDGKLATEAGRTFYISDFNRLLTYSRDEVVSSLVREFTLDTIVARRTVDYAFSVLEYKESVDIDDLEHMIISPGVEDVFVKIAYGFYVYPVSETGDLKRIGISECLRFAEEGRVRLYEALKNCHRIDGESRLPESVAEEAANIIFDIYLSLAEGEGLDEFMERIIQLDVSNYVVPLTQRHRFIREFKEKGESAITPNEGIFDAVLDCMGIYDGLEDLKKLKGKTEDMNLYWVLYIYISSFEVGPRGYIPVEIEDAWRSFRVWKDRVGDVTYDDVQKKIIELYIRYIRDAKGDIPRWGWTFLWLCCFKEGSRIYNAVCDLLKEVWLRQDVDTGALMDELGEKYKLNTEEKGMFLSTAPIDGFITLVQIYCKDIPWGRVGLKELEEGLRRDMNVVMDSDVTGEDLFNEDVDSWLYTFRNIPDEVGETIKNRLKGEIVELVLSRLKESGLTGCSRLHLEQLVELIYRMRLPSSGERFIDRVSIIDLRKILFDYARGMIKDDQPLRKLHFDKNLLEKGDRHLFFQKRCLSPFSSARRLLIFTHRHSETIGLLYWVQKLLEENPLLEVRIIPQKSLWELNSTREDILALLKGDLKRLGRFQKKGRFVVLDNCAPGLSWLKGPERAMVKGEIANADTVLVIGWNNFVSLQGLNRPCYFSFGIDDSIIGELTGCNVGEQVFVKTCGGVPASKIGVYRLSDYLNATTQDNYKTLLSYFSGDMVKLHEWIRKEARRTGRSEIDVMRSTEYSTEPVKVFGGCALKEVDADVREEALDILLNNYERFGIEKETSDLVRLGDAAIRTGKKGTGTFFSFGEKGACPLFPAAVLVKDGKRLILEVLEKDDTTYLRIGDKGYRIEGEVRLDNILLEPALWVGNSQLVEFFGAMSIHGLVERERGPPGVSITDIPQDIIRQIPQTRPTHIYKSAEGFFASPISPSPCTQGLGSYLPLQLHYAVVLLSSPNISQRVKGWEELERLRSTGDKEILDIIRLRGLSRVSDWLDAEVPHVGSIINLANFTDEQERCLRVLCGGYLLRPPLVKMPGQGVSAEFHDSVGKGISAFGVELVRNNYAEGSGSVRFHDGARHFVKAGDLLLDLSKRLLQGQMLGAIRLKKDKREIIQVPANAGLLNYLKVIHHLAHIMAARFVTGRGREPDVHQEFTPAIDDILIIKFMERLVENSKDGFGDFKEEVGKVNNEEELREVFTRYGLGYPVGRTLAGIKEDISGINDMLGFSSYIERNNLGSFTSVKEFLRVLINYMQDIVKDYIKKLPQQEQIILERLLKVHTDNEINDLLIVASLLAGSYIPKVDFTKDIDILVSLLNRPRMTAVADKGEILGRIDTILEGGEPFSSKAVRIVGTILYRMGIKVSQEERREIEEDVMDVLSGKWLQTLETALEERINKLETDGIDTRDLGDRLGEVRSYMIGESRRLGKPQPVEQRDAGIDIIDSWSKIVDYVKAHNIKRVFCDIDKTIIDAPGFITTTPWFIEMQQKEGLKETIRLWRELEEGLLKKRGMVHPMEDCIPGVINTLRGMGVEVILYTAREELDIPRTKEMLSSVGIEGLEIIASKGGTPEQKRDALVEHYKTKGWFDKEEVPTLYIDDTLANVRAVCGDSRFGHIKGVWYRAHYQKRYEVNPEEFLVQGDNALRSGNAMDALLWYYDALYITSRKDMANLVYDIVAEDMGFSASIERVFSRFIKDRLNRYRGALERERVWIEPRGEKKPEGKKVIWREGAPDVTSPGFLEGVKRIIVIGSHPHGDHISGFLDYAKRRLGVLVDTAPPQPSVMKTGGPITHAISNYWGRIGEETIVFFDLGWFPEGFVDPLIQTINPRDREILFIMDPATERTLDFNRKIQRAKLQGVKVDVLPYGNLMDIPIERGRIMQIENYPAYHLAPQVGSSIYIIRVLDANTREEIQSIGYVSELGDVFPEKVDEVLLEKLARLNRLIEDGTNLIAPKGEEPLPLRDRPNKVDGYVKGLNHGRYLIAHFNTQSLRMGEEAEIASQNLDPGIPIIVIGGKDAIEQLRRSYNVPKDRDYYTIGDRKVYLVHDVAGFHKRWRESGNAPRLEDVLDERIRGLRSAGWTEDEIREFVEEWRKNDGLEIKEYKGPEGKVKELEAFLWDLRKTKVVVISSSQFRGNPTQKRYQNFKGFQILDAIVDRKDACILIEGRLHLEDREGEILRILLDKRKDREIPTITGRKKVRATIDNQWRTGHITSREFMNLNNRIINKAVEIGNIYNVRSYIPFPQKEWFSVISEGERAILLRKYGQEGLDSVIDILKRWNDRRDVSETEIRFAKKVMKRIFESPEFWSRFLGISDAEDLRDELIIGLNRIEEEQRLSGRANIRIFVASTSKFIDVLRRVRVVTDKGVKETRQLQMEPAKISELLRMANRVIGLEFGISYEYGETVDLVRRERRVYSRDIMKKLNRGYLRDLYSQTIKGKIPPDLSEYLGKGKRLEEYREELEEILERIKKKAEGEELFGIWFGELRRYIESQFFRIGIRHADRVVPYSKLRQELSLLYDAVIEYVYRYLQEDMGYGDIAIIAGDDYAQGKVLFKDAIRLGILVGDGVSEGYANSLRNRMLGILNKLGIPAESGDWTQFLHRRIVVGKGELKEIRLEGMLTRRKNRFSGDVKVLKGGKGFDIHKGPGGLDDIELIRHFFSSTLSNEERAILNETEDFLRRYKEEIGFSAGGDREKAKGLFREIMDNLGFKGAKKEFNEELLRRVSRIYTILKRAMGVKNISFGDIDEVEDIHKGVFEKAAGEGRLLGEDFELIKEMKRENPVLKSRKFKVIEEEPGKPTMFYREEPFSSVLSHSGKRTNTIYVGLNTLMLVQKNPRHRGAFRNLLLHENRDIERGYHMDMEDEVSEGIITHEDVDSIYMLWNDLLTDGRFSVMYDLYMERAKKHRFREYFMDRIPADVRIIKGKELFEFKHGDIQDLPDFIGLNLRLFKGDFSPQTQVFLLRHCTDRVRYDRDKTIINDMKYLLTVSEQEREKILGELKELEYVEFLKGILGEPEKAKERIREYVGLRFETYKSPDGANIWYSVGGNPDAKRTLVFLHGIGVNSRDWRHQIALFEKDYRIIAIDLRGFGKSKGLGTKPPHIKNYADDVEGILTKEGITDAILVGHSMGGMVALNMEELYKDIPLEERRIKGLVLIATDAGNPLRRFFEIVRRMILNLIEHDRLWKSRFFQWVVKNSGIAELLGITQRETHPLFTRKVISSVFKSSKESLIYALESWETHDVEDKLGNLQIPVLWIIGEGDKATPPKGQKEQAKLIRDCKVIALPEACHYPHATFPRQVNRKINRFINEGTYRFSQLVCEKIKERFPIDVSLDDLEVELKSIKMRHIPKLSGINEEDLRLIDEISRIVVSCGQKTGVSSELMTKAVMIVASQVIPRPSITLPPARPISREDIEKLYDCIVQSV